MTIHSLASLLPPSLRRTLRAIVDAPGRWAFRRALRRVSFKLPTGETVLSFGGAIPRKKGAVVHGGRVKLGHLERAFPEGRESYNILYLVSSAIPRHALELVKHAQSHGVKFVWNQNGVGFPAWAGGDSEEVNGPMRKLRERADFVVYQSVFCRESAERFLGHSTSGSAVLYNPVDLEMFRPAATPPPAEPWHLLAAGTHMEAERVTRAIETIAELRRRGCKALLTVAGQFRWPRAHEEIREAIRREEVDKWIYLRPAYSQDEAVQMLQSAHILLHLKYHDPCPTAVVEALACGVPVIGSKSGGLSELLGADVGEVLPVSQSWDQRHYPDAADLAVAVQRIMTSWPERSVAARAHAEQHFDHREWVERHREIFERLLAA